MTGKINCFTLAVALLLAGGGNVRAEQGDFAAGGKVGTLGLGAEIQGGIYENYYGRVGLNMLSYSLDSTVSDIDYDFDTKFVNGSLLLDWYPAAGPFRVTAGYFLNNNKIDVHGTPQSGKFSGDYAELSRLGDEARLNGTVEFNSASFYAGLGWTSNLRKKGWSVGFDVGVLFQGAASVTSLYFALSGDEPEEEYDKAFQSTLDDFLKKERSHLESHFNDYKYYPVISCVITYNF